MMSLLRDIFRMIAPRLTMMAGLAAMLSPCLAGCSAPGNDYAEYANIPSKGWKYGDTLRFTPVHPDSLCRGRLAVGIRHENSFPYTSLWLETTVDDNGRKKVDTVEISLADSFGTWTGRGIGASFQKADTVAGSFLHASGSIIKVRHIMRADTLRGVTQVGIFFIPEE